MEKKNLNIAHFSKVHFESKHKNTVVLRMQLHEPEEVSKKEKKID